MSDPIPPSRGPSTGKMLFWLGLVVGVLIAVGVMLVMEFR
jgi:hypothetical protein